MAASKSVFLRLIYIVYEMIINTWYLTRFGVGGKFANHLSIVSHLAVGFVNWQELRIKDYLNVQVSKLWVVDFY